jgi:hypothetical protein
MTITLVDTLNFKPLNLLDQSAHVSSCLTLESNLPMNHTSHPCNAVYMPNKSWISWLSNDNNSAHLHFLDLIELLHYSFH